MWFTSLELVFVQWSSGYILLQWWIFREWTKLLNWSIWAYWSVNVRAHTSGWRWTSPKELYKKLPIVVHQRNTWFFIVFLKKITGNSPTSLTMGGGGPPIISLHSWPFQLRSVPVRARLQSGELHAAVRDDPDPQRHQMQPGDRGRAVWVVCVLKCVWFKQKYIE